MRIPFEEPSRIIQPFARPGRVVLARPEESIVIADAVTLGSIPHLGRRTERGVKAMLSSMLHAVPHHALGIALDNLGAVHAAAGLEAVQAVPRAILPDGRAILPDSWAGGYHGTSSVPPEVAMRDGLPARGNDWRLLEHSEQRGDSAFRGTTDFPTDPSGRNGAACWAGEGGWVYEIRHVPSWDVNADLEGRVRTPAGFRGNLMYGECERAVPARVPPENIKRFGRVEEDSMGHLYVHRWVDNPRYISPRE